MLAKLIGNISGVCKVSARKQDLKKLMKFKILLLPSFGPWNNVFKKLQLWCFILGLKSNLLDKQRVLCVLKVNMSLAGRRKKLVFRWVPKYVFIILKFNNSHDQIGSDSECHKQVLSLSDTFCPWQNLFHLKESNRVENIQSLPLHQLLKQHFFEKKFSKGSSTQPTFHITKVTPLRSNSK